SLLLGSTFTAPSDGRSEGDALKLSGVVARIRIHRFTCLSCVVGITGGPQRQLAFWLGAHRRFAGVGEFCLMRLQTVAQLSLASRCIKAKIFPLRQSKHSTPQCALADARLTCLG